MNVARFTFPEMAASLGQLDITMTEGRDRDHWKLVRGEFSAAYWPLDERLRISFQSKERILSVKLPRLFRVVSKIVEILHSNDVSLQMIYMRAAEIAAQKEEDEYEYVDEEEGETEAPIVENVVKFNTTPGLQEGTMNELQYYLREIRAVEILLQKAKCSTTKSEMALHIQRAHDKLTRVKIPLE